MPSLAPSQPSPPSSWCPASRRSRRSPVRRSTRPPSSASRPAPKGGAYRAEITRTKHGILHIEADDWGSLGYGEGYAAAETSICNLDTVLTARGERSRFLGADARYADHVTLDATNLQSDTLFSDIRNRRVVEKLLADLVAGRAGRPARW